MDFKYALIGPVDKLVSAHSDDLLRMTISGEFFHISFETTPKVLRTYLKCNVYLLHSRGCRPMTSISSPR